MCAIAERTPLTPEEFLRRPDAKDFELLDGELVERAMGNISSWVGGEIVGRLREHCKAHDLGLVFPADAGYRCFPASPRTVRRPDASFIATGRLPADWQDLGYFRIAPDLVVEVVSPNDVVEQLEIKVAAFLDAGTRLVWVVLPSIRAVRIYRADGSEQLSREGEELDGEDVVPGFRSPIGGLFPPRPTPGPDA